MKLLIALTIILLANNKAISATPPTECGEYMVNGIVREKNDKLNLIIFEKTLSEHIIASSPIEEMKLSPYVDTPVSAKVTLTKKTLGLEFEAEKIENIQSRLPDPLNPKDNSIVLLAKKACDKK